MILLWIFWPITHWTLSWQWKLYPRRNSCYVSIVSWIIKLKECFLLFYYINALLEETSLFQVKDNVKSAQCEKFNFISCQRLQDQERLGAHMPVLGAVYSFAWKTREVRFNASGRVKTPAKPIGDFLITFGLFFKASAGAHPFIWKLVFIHIQVKMIFIWKDERQDSLWKEAKGNSEMAYWFCSLPRVTAVVISM